jgi:hypothetical protein
VLSQPYPPGSPAGALASHGWNDALEADLVPHRALGLLPACIGCVDRGLITAMVPGGSVRATPARAVPTDALHGNPCTGDWGSGTQPEFAALLPRRAALVPSSASKTSRGQVLTANIGRIAIVATFEAKVDESRLERFRALGWESGGQPLVVLTKAGLVETSPALQLNELAGTGCRHGRLGNPLCHRRRHGLGCRGISRHRSTSGTFRRSQVPTGERFARERSYGNRRGSGSSL